MQMHKWLTLYEHNTCAVKGSLLYRHIYHKWYYTGNNMTGTTSDGHLNDWFRKTPSEKHFVKLKLKYGIQTDL